MNLYDLHNLYDDTYLFNNIAGNFENITQKSFTSQASFMLEEAQETHLAALDNDKVEMLDGCIDTLVTTFGMLKMLEKVHQCDISKAMQLVAENNLSKFPTNIEVAKDSCLQTGYTYTKHPVFGSYIIKDANGKIRKPSTFKPVDLSVCFPEEH